MNRRLFVKQTSLATSALLLSKYTTAWGREKSFPVVRTPENLRKFKSKAVEKVIDEIKNNIGNKEIAWLFENCFPNTLDTTVDFSMADDQPDTYVITGDIDAMWLRDSSVQVWPYLPLCKEDEDLKQMIKGLIMRQTRCILKDPYANAFYKDENKQSEWSSDKTKMQPGIHERKWELDSLCHTLRLAHGYWKETGDVSPFDKDWHKAVKLILKTFVEQQRLTDKGPYSFMRKTECATDTVPLDGYGYPAKPDNLICSMFRPSDDATIFPYHVPSNIFACLSFAYIIALNTATNGDLTIDELRATNRKMLKALSNDTVIRTRNSEDIFVYETNGFGSYNIMDDANVPSLLSLSYYGPSYGIDRVGQNTRKFVLSAENPFFFSGKAGEGIGSPHTGMDMIWPISIIMRGLTSNDDAEIKQCLDTLQHTHAGKGFMHESFHKDDAANFTRPWFAMANSLFGEFVWKVYREKPGLLNG